MQDLNCGLAIGWDEVGHVRVVGGQDSQLDQVQFADDQVVTNVVC